jgi:hypothetical protein
MWIDPKDSGSPSAELTREDMAVLKLDIARPSICDAAILNVWLSTHPAILSMGYAEVLPRCGCQLLQHH